MQQARGGPLNPPAGAIAPSGRTLNEVYDRIPTGDALGAYDGRTPILGPMTITTPGSYVLRDNITSAGASTLAIAASGVTIDLNGCSVVNTATGTCISITGSRENISIFNGSLRDGNLGVSDEGFVGSVSSLRLENLRIGGSRLAGIELSRTSAALIRRCDIADIGVRSLSTDIAVVGISLGGLSGRVDECSVHNLVNNSTGTPVTRGIYQFNSGARGFVIQRCQLGNPATVNGIGINPLASSTCIRDCTVRAYSTTYSGGTGGGGNAG